MLELKVRVSAPGKALFFGEHAVVYGKPSLTIALDKRVYVEAKKLEESIIKVKTEDLQVSGIDVKLSFGTNKVDVVSDHDKLQNVLNYINVPIKKIFERYNIESGVDINVKSELIAGAGLGSSAAISAATIKAISELFKLNLTNEEIFNLGVETKLGIEKQVSGSDVAAATFGGIVYYKNKNVKKIETNLELPIIIGYSKMAGKTSEMVKRVTEMREKYPEVINNIFNSIEKVTEDALAILINNGSSKKLGELMNINQGLLESLGVSTYKLSQLIYAARNAGAYGAKISGAGGGKCIIVLSDKRTFDIISKSIELVDGLPIIAKIPKEGVRIEK